MKFPEPRVKGKSDSPTELDRLCSGDSPGLSGHPRQEGLFSYTAMYGTHSLWPFGSSLICGIPVIGDFQAPLIEKKGTGVRVTVIDINLIEHS